jgi:ribonuclease P protein component
MRSSAEFSATVRSGRRAGTPTVVLHWLADADAGEPARVGYVVSKAVGNSVARHRVVRRLRAQTAQRAERVPAGSLLVVRALPPAATASSATLGSDVGRAFDRLWAA